MHNNITAERGKKVHGVRIFRQQTVQSRAENGEILD